MVILCNVIEALDGVMSHWINTVPSAFSTKYRLGFVYCRAGQSILG